jgi:molybdopterin-guanine dinucleotide biosynthesis protein B
VETARAREGGMKILGLAGWSGAGKTTLLAKLIPELNRRGITVSTLKHAHHAFDVDQPGKDSHVHREAGATEVMVASANRWALMHEHRGAPEPGSAELIRHMTPVDLLLIEGFKRETHDKLEVHRKANGKPLIAPDDPLVVAILSDGPVPETRLPVLDLNDIAAIADFVMRHCGLVAKA